MNRESIFFGQKLLANIAIGLAAALLVPLFLNSISSTVIQSVNTDDTKLFVLIGFCVGASIFARQFIDSVGKRALRLAETANAKADGAVAVARDSSSRATALIEPIQIVGTGNYRAAIQALKQVLRDDFANAEAHAWLAYCLKRAGALTSAIEEIRAALELDKREIFSWLYNLACYECLAGASAERVVALLNRALKAANDKQKAGLKTDLMGDDDYVKIKDHPAFLNFLDNL